MDQDPFFTPAHKVFRARVREFAERDLLPRSREWDQRAALPREALRLMAGAGLLNILGPEHLGGQALDYVSLGIAIEEIAACDISCAQIA